MKDEIRNATSVYSSFFITLSSLARQTFSCAAVPSRPEGRKKKYQYQDGKGNGVVAMLATGSRPPSFQ